MKVPCYRLSLVLRFPKSVCTVLYYVESGVVALRRSRSYTIKKLRSGLFQRNVIRRQGVSGRLWVV
jgi:hypothetical protein